MCIMDILWTRFDSWCICCQNVRHKFYKMFFGECNFPRLPLFSLLRYLIFFAYFLFFSFNFLKQYLSARNLLWSNDQKTLVFSVGFQERAHCLNVNQGNQTCLDPWLKKICSDSWLVGKFTSVLTGIFVTCS